MQNPLPHTIAGNTFWVFPERCLFWEDTATLIIADLHLGKTGHFRKAGIGVPQTIYKADLQRLMAMLYLCKANRLIIVGDFTHSTINKEMELFLRWRKDFSSLHIDLVKGNHDILEAAWYKEAAIMEHEWEMQENGFVFRHETKKSKAPDTTGALYTFTGHVHPGIVLKGTGKQSLKLPCFYFTPSYCILPAFSRFTGMYTVHPAKGEVAYASTDTEIIRIG
jgi:uncharacterized protein